MSADRRCLHLLYKPGGYPHPTREDARHYLRNPWCSPGLGTVVRRYIAAEYGHQPEEVLRRRQLYLDSGGIVLTTDPVVVVPFDGWCMRVRRMDLPTWVDAWAERLARPPKVYPGGVQAVRVAARFYTAIIRPEEAAHLLAVLRPQVQAAALALQAQHARLAGIPGVQVRGTQQAVQE